MQVDDDRFEGSERAMRHVRTTHLQKWLKIDAENRPRVYAQIYEGTELSSLSYWLGILFSAGIATFGLIQNSPAVIIGAMLISPLMGPIMAAGLGLALGDLYLALKAIFNLVASIAVSVSLSALIVWLLPFHSATGEILSRTNPTLLDLGIAIFCGLAGSVGVGRAGASALAALPGVAIGVALMPPLCSVGFGIGSGFNTRIMGGAGLLFLTNLVAIISSAFAVFLLIGMNVPEVAGQMEKSREDEFLARRYLKGRAGRILAGSGGLGWRILVVAILLAAIAFPLKSAFVQLTQEATARSAVQQVVKNLLPADALLSQQVDVGRHSIAIRLFTTTSIPDEKQRQAEQTIQEASGRPTQLSVLSVASQSELAEIADRLSVVPPPQPAIAAPAAPSVDALRNDLLKQMDPIVAAIWPPEIPVVAYDVAISQSGVELDIRYKGEGDLSPIALGLLTRQFQGQLKLPGLSLNTHRIPEPPRIRRQAQRRSDR